MKNKEIDLQQALQDIAHAMVRLKKPDRLLRLIVKFIDTEFELSHSSFLIRDTEKNRYVFYDSKGTKRIPSGLVKFDADHPFVIWFHSRNKKLYKGSEYLEYDQVSRWVESYKNQPESRALTKIQTSMKMLSASLIFPCFSKRELVGFLILGPKKDNQFFSKKEITFFMTIAQDCSMAVMASEYHQNLIKQNETLDKQLKEIERLRDLDQKRYLETVKSLAQQVDAKDHYTYGHIGQVERLGMMTAKELGIDLSGERKKIVSASFLLHDVGKIGIPDHVLNKKEKLTDEEWEIMKTHVEKGVQILEPLTAFSEVKDIVYAHHERMDGKGYPRGLKGDEIPMIARIVNVVDSFHAIVSSRCYSKGKPIEFGFEELRRCSGTQFDAEVVEAFITALTREMKKRKSGSFHKDYGAKKPVSSS